MKKRRVFLATTLLVSVITFTGCGTPLYEMTPEEEDLITKYAAYALGKYNTYQKDGMNGAMYVEESDDSEAESPEKEDGEEEIKENDETNKSDSTEPEDSTEDKSEYVKPISLGKCLGNKKLSVKYKGLKVKASYQEGKYYSMDAEAGKKYVITKFKIKNDTSKKVKVDAISQNAKFKADFGDGNWVLAEETFLTYSLTTYQGTIKSGESVDVVLIFQIPEQDAKKISKPSLGVTLDGKNYLVQL